MSTLLNLPDHQFWLVILICLLAGIVRGFSGFALSALVMASAALIIPPIELIPVCWWLALCAGLMMIRGGWKEADRRLAITLVVGSSLGMPLGLYLTTQVSVPLSQTLALGCIATLAALLLGKIKLDFLANPKGHLGVGVCAGIATGLASVGGMVVALFVLVSNVPARQMRATLVVFLLLSGVLSLIILIAFGVMDERAALRGVILSIPATLGVYLGTKFFIPRLEPFYRPFCLLLLIGLALMGLIRIGL